MPDETGTETTRSDAPSADDSLFGEAADDTEAAVADEQDSNEESAQDPQGADDAEDQAVGDETGSSEDLKVVVSIKGGRATIGVQRPSSDPHIETFDDPDLPGLTQEALAVIERARAKWEDEPKYPAHERPAPPARRRNRRRPGPPRKRRSNSSRRCCCSRGRGQGRGAGRRGTLTAVTGGGRRNGDGFPLPSHV